MGCGYIVRFIDENGDERFGGRCVDFIEAQKLRNNLINKGFEAWIEETDSWLVEFDSTLDTW